NTPPKAACHEGYQSIGTGLTSTLLSSQTTNTHRCGPRVLLAASGATSLLYQVARGCQVQISEPSGCGRFPEHNKSAVSGDLVSGRSSGTDRHRSSSLHCPPGSPPA